MVQKYSKGQILNNLSKKSIMNSVRDKYREKLMKQDKLSAKKAADFTSGQNKIKNALAGRFAHKSERQINEILKDELKISPVKRRELIDDIKGGGQLTKHQIIKLKKEFERVRNRNVAMSRNDRDRFAAVMGDEELHPKKSQQLSSLRGKMKESENVKSTAKSIGVNTRKNVKSFAGGNSRSSSPNSTASTLGGDNPAGLAGGIGSNPGGGGIKFAA